MADCFLNREIHGKFTAPIHSHIFRLFDCRYIKQEIRSMERVSAAQYVAFRMSKQVVMY